MKIRPFALTGSALTVMILALAGRALAAETLTILPDEIINVNSGPKAFFPQSLRVKMKFAGPDRSLLSTIQSVRVVPTRATDDTGLSLLDPEKYGADWQHVYVFPTLQAELDSPARGALTLRELSGSVEIYRPQLDPASVVTIANVSQLSPQTLDEPRLLAAGIQINVITFAQIDRYRESLRDPKISYPPDSQAALKRVYGRSLDNYLKGNIFKRPGDFEIRIVDPNKQLADSELISSDGQRINSSKSSTGGVSTYSLSDPPPGFGLRLWVATPQSVEKIPFDFADLALSARAPQPPVAAIRINDDRQSASSLVPGSLDIKLKIALPEVERARAIRVAVISAKDATGKPLVKTALFPSRWDDIRATDNRQTTSASISLDTPARGAATLREVAGTIELYQPARDPQSVVTIANITDRAGQILTDPTLKSLGLQIAFLNQEQAERARQIEINRPSENPKVTPEIKSELFKALKELFGVLAVDEKTLALRVTDPNARLVDVAVETADGETLKRTGRSRSADLQTYRFESAIPPDARLKIYVATPKSLVPNRFE